MSKRPQAELEEEATTPPSDSSITTPITGDTAATRVRIKVVEDSVGEIKDDIREIKNHRHTDFVHVMQMLGAGFLVLAGMLISGYFILDAKLEKLSSKVDALTATIIRADTKLEDLLARIPPARASPPTQGQSK